MTFPEFASYIFYGSMGGIAAYAAFTLGKMRESIEALNVSVAVLIEQGKNLERRVDKLENQ